MEGPTAHGTLPLSTAKYKKGKTVAVRIFLLVWSRREREKKKQDGRGEACCEQQAVNGRANGPWHLALVNCEVQNGKTVVVRVYLCVLFSCVKNKIGGEACYEQQAVNGRANGPRHLAFVNCEKNEKGRRSLCACFCVCVCCLIA